MSPCMWHVSSYEFEYQPSRANRRRIGAQALFVMTEIAGHRMNVSKAMTPELGL